MVEQFIILEKGWGDIVGWKTLVWILILWAVLVTFRLITENKKGPTSNLTADQTRAIEFIRDPKNKRIVNTSLLLEQIEND